MSPLRRADNSARNETLLHISFFFFNDTATTEIYTLSLHDALPIKSLGLHKTPVHLHPEVDVEILVNVARSAEEAERQAKGESATVREETTMADLGLEVGAALAEA